MLKSCANCISNLSDVRQEPCKSCYVWCNHAFHEPPQSVDPYDKLPNAFLETYKLVKKDMRHPYFDGWCTSSPYCDLYKRDGQYYVYTAEEGSVCESLKLIPNEVLLEFILDKYIPSGFSEGGKA